MTSGRRPVTPARGRVTLAQAAEFSGLSYAEVHRRVSTGAAPGEQDPSGVWTMRRADAKKLTRREPANKRPGTNLRAAPERWAQWDKEAERRGLAVSSLASQLLDDASRIPPERWATWEREAGRRGMAVSALAAKLLDEASGWGAGGPSDTAQPTAPRRKRCPRCNQLLRIVDGEIEWHNRPSEPFDLCTAR